MHFPSEAKNKIKVKASKNKAAVYKTAITL